MNINCYEGLQLLALLVSEVRRFLNSVCLQKRVDLGNKGRGEEGLDRVRPKNKDIGTRKWWLS